MSIETGALQLVRRPVRARDKICLAAGFLAVRERGRRTAEFDCADLHCVVRVVVRQRS
jgi:hypothetical protein